MAKYVSQTLSYCASESNKFTSSNARQSKRLNGERENIIEKKWVRQFYLTWKKFCLCDREIAQQKVINYETIARRKKAQDCVCIYCILVCYHMLQYTQSHIDFDHHPRRPIVSFNNFSFFPRLFFPYNSFYFHFSIYFIRLLINVCLCSLTASWTIQNWYMIFLSYPLTK